MKSKVFCALSLLLFGIPFSRAQQSYYEQYLREHNKKILTAEDADDSYDELKKTVLAKQMYGDSYLLMVDTVASSTYRTRTESVITRDGVGFSIDLSNVGNRTLLRIHPDGGVRGTQGCIGLNGTIEELQQFVSLVGTLFSKGLNPVVNVNIEGNPQYFKP